MQASYGEKCVRDASKLKVLYKTVRVARSRVSTFAEDLGGRSQTGKTAPRKTAWKPATNKRGDARKPAANCDNQPWEGKVRKPAAHALRETRRKRRKLAGNLQETPKPNRENRSASNLRQARKNCVETRYKQAWGRKETRGEL